jgi:hypothetical protein
MQWRARERRLTGAARACGDLRRRRRHRSLPRLFPRAARAQADRRRAGRGRLRGVGQVRRLPGARLVRRHPARASRAPQLCASREPRRGSLGGLGLPPHDDLRRPWRLRASRRGRPPPPAVALRGRRPDRPSRHARDDGASPSGPLHAKHDVRRRGAWRRAAPRRRDRDRTPLRRRRRGPSRRTRERSPPTPSSSPWGRGRALPPNGCRSRRSTASRATASSSRPVRACRPRRCSSNIGKPRARAPRPRCFRAPTARPMSARSRPKARCRRTRQTSCPTPAPSSASRRSAGRCRRCWPRARSLRARPATAR